MSLESKNEHENETAPFELKRVKGLKVARKDKCDFCIHKGNLRVGNVNFDRVRCCHPKVMEIQEKYPERKPGLIAAEALNKMGKELNLRIHPAAYKNRWFNWPYCYNSVFIESCAGFERGP